MQWLASDLCFDQAPFIHYLDVSRPHSQATYHVATSLLCAGAESLEKLYHRAGPHADRGFVTLLSQKKGQSVLEERPGCDGYRVWDWG